MVVSGTPEDMTYDYAADLLGMALAKLVVEGEEITRDMARMTMTMGPVSGTSRTALSGDMRSVTQSMEGDLSIDVAANDPGSDDSMVFTARMNGVSLSSETSIPQSADYSDPQALFESGFAAAGEFQHNGSMLDFALTEGRGATTGKMTTSSGRVKFGMSGDAMTYEVGNTDMVVALQGPDIPLPINGEMAETSFSFSLPLQPSETPQDAAIGLTLAGFKTSDMIWGIFDPGAVLPRDPATVALDMIAKVTPFVSLLDEEAMERIEDGDVIPGELNAVTLNSLTVEAAGGKITGEGAFTFDNSDLESFDGMPRPEGQLDLSVSGANGLIDKIIQMGLMSEEDAMGARMMLSMFTVPGAEPDTATSVIEVNDQGHVLANGQRLK